MDNVKLALILLVVVLGGTTFYLFVQSTAAKAQVESAQTTNQLTLELLRAQGVSCGANSLEFSRTAECIRPALLQKDFKEDGFSQPGAKGAGYLVIKNVNKKTYAAGNFTLLFNREVVQQGCHIPGDIGYNVACRFEFPQRCEEGYVLEVNYTYGGRPTKVFTKNC